MKRFGIILLALFLCFTLIPLLLSSAQTSSANTSFDKEQDNTVLAMLSTAYVFEYPKFSSTAGLSLVGDVLQIDNKLRLTSATEWQTGAVWYTTPLFVQDGFESIFQFQITNLGGVHPESVGADGFAFVVQNSSVVEIGGTGQGVGYGNEGPGLEGIPNSLAIELDTWRNGWESNGNHISVQTKGVEPNDPSHLYSIGSTTSLPDLSGTVYTVAINYVPGSMRIFVEDMIEPVLTVDVDLSETLNMDEGKAWIGFTSATGDSWQDHDILNWSYKLLCYSLSTSVSPNGSGTLSAAPSNNCSGDKYAAGTTVQLTATANSGWRVASWSGTDKDNSTSNNNTLTMPENDHTATVNYELIATVESLVLLPVIFDGYSEGLQESEPNDADLQADGPLPSGQLFRGYPDDRRDYVTFTAIAPGQIEVHLNDHVGQGVQLQLFHGPASDENRVTVDLESPYDISYSGEAGTYYVMIYTEAGFDDATPYTLWVTYPSS